MGTQDRNFRFFLFHLFIVAIYFPSISGAENSPSSLSRGTQFYNKGEYQKALDEFQQILKENPSNASGHYYLGLTLGKLGRQEEAVRAFQKAAELDSQLPGVHLSLGIAHYKLKEYGQARTAFKKTLKKEPGNSSAQFFLGLIYQEKGLYKTSTGYFKQVAKSDAGFKQLALFNIGLNYYKNKENDKAKRFFIQARNVDPDSETGRDSKRFLGLLSRRQETAKSEKRWDLYGSVGVEFDDNVTRVEQDIVSGQSDVAFLFEVGGEYRLIQTPTFEFQAGYEFFQSLFQEVTSLNFQSHNFSLSASKDVGSTNLGGDYNYIFTTLNEEDFLGIHTFSPRVGFFLTPNLYTTINYLFLNKNFFTDNSRDADNHSFGFSQFLFFMKSKAYIVAGYRFQYENAKGSEFDYLGHVPSLGMKIPFIMKSELRASYKYHLKDYQNITPNIFKKREDKIQSIRLALSRKFYKIFTIKLDYEYTDSDSNLATTDFTENTVTLSFGFEL